MPSGGETPQEGEVHLVGDSPSDAAPSKETVVIHVPRLTARTFPGSASPQNKGAIDWGGHGLLAYGCNYTVVVVDSTNVQVIQCLDRHKSMVKKVLWGRDYLSQDKQSSPRLYGTVDLVSSDATGNIIVWDICSGKPLAILQEGNKPVVEMAWVTDCDGNNHVLAALHPPYSLVLWDTRTGSKLWKKTYTEQLQSFCFDPFHPSKMAFHCTDCILFIDDFSVPRIPSSNGRKFYVSTPKTKPDDKFNRDRFRRLMKEMVIGELRPKPDDGMTVTDCLEVSYHRSLRHHVVLMYPKEVLILDLHINQTVGIIPLGDKSASPFIQALSCKQRDVIYCLHNNGSISVKVRKRPAAVSSPLGALAHSVSSLDLSGEGQMELCYEHKCSSESMRQTRGLQILGMTVNPVCERRIGLYLNTGKIVFLELHATDESTESTHVLVDRDGTEVFARRDTLKQILPSSLFKEASIPTLRLFITGLLPSVAAPLSTLRMCPAITTRNWQSYTPLLATGTTGGLIQVHNVATGELEKEFIVHSYTVRGIEWAGLKNFLSYAFLSAASQTVRNELCLTNVVTGDSESLRTDRGEEPPIDILRVSPQKQYFILVLSGGPVELWDLKAKHLLRTLPKKFPIVTALEWSPTHNARSLRRRQSSKDECLLDASVLPPLERAQSSDRLVAKEYFVFSDSQSQLYHFTVEGHQLKDVIRIPPESGAGTVTAIAYKTEQIVQGDADGLLSVWDLRLYQARRHSTSRGYIRRMRFAPGKGNLNLLILYNDGVDIIDVKGGTQFEKCAQLKCPRDMVKVLDIDWAASDRPVLATADGCIRIMDLDLVACSSTVLDYDFAHPVYCPALLPTDVVYKLRERLCWQLTDSPYTIEMTEDQGFTAGQVARIREQLSMADPALLANLRLPTFRTAERCLLVAQLFGDLMEIDFWTIALYYLQVSQALQGKDSLKEEVTTDSVASSPILMDCEKVNLTPGLEPLDTCYDVIQDDYTYQKLQLERVALHESRRSDYQLTRRVIQQLLLLGQTDRAVQLLLETDLKHPDYYTDAIKACLVATVRDTGAAQSTVKLVATNLIANGSIWDGVQLLCLIGKGLDACRYLESYNHWGSAVWLARAVLPPNDACEVIRKWADHLSSMGFKEKAVLVLMSLRQWTAAYSLLSVMDPRRASLLAQAFEDFGLSPAS